MLILVALNIQLFGSVGVRTAVEAINPSAGVKGGLIGGVLKE